MRLLSCLMVSLFVCPVIASATTQETNAQVAGVPQAVPASQGQPAAPASETAQTQRALLEQRVTAKWDALIRKDFATAYTFTSPAYRKLYPLDAFKRNFGAKVTWRRIEVLDVNFKGDDAATVGINIHIVYHSPQAENPLDMKTYVQEPWVRVDGQWWYLMNE